MKLEVGQIVKALCDDEQGRFKKYDMLEVINLSQLDKHAHVKNITRPILTEMSSAFIMPGEYTTSLGADTQMTTASETGKEKAQLTQEQSDALQYALQMYDDETSLIAEFIRNSREDFKDDDLDLEPLLTLNTDQLIRAIYVGVDIKKTPEQEIAEQFIAMDEAGSITSRGYKAGILFVLEN